MINKLNIIILGVNGQLGMEFKNLFTQFDSQFNFFAYSKDDLDILDNDKLKQIFVTRKFHYCINCAAYTKVDLAEKENTLNRAINNDAVKKIAILCGQYNITLIHFSTDYVFDGNNNIPYKENDKTNPINNYGNAKLKGEQAALKNNFKTIIFRVSWVYSEYGHNFVKTMLKLMSERPQISVVADQKGSPTYAKDIAFMILNIIQDKSIEKYYSNIFHFTNAGITNWYEFACVIKQIKQLSCTIVPIKTNEYFTLTKRPAYAVLDTHKFTNAFQLPLQNWQTSLKKCLEHL